MGELSMDPPEGPDVEPVGEWETRHNEHSDKYNKACEVWRKWAREHAVKESGTCTEWVLSPQIEDYI
jgi:hypothetical protein